MPALIAGLIDDAAVFPPGSAPLADAVRAHHQHRAAWYAPAVGPLLVPATGLTDLLGLIEEPVGIGVIGDVPIPRLGAMMAAVGERAVIRQFEVPVAKRGEDPQPGLAELAKLRAAYPAVPCYAEIPLTWGLLSALDTVAAQRGEGEPVAPKFRTGGLAAELFPTPVELAAVICACRDRELPFKLTAGLHRAVRHADPETGFVHHGFLNVLAGVLRADDGAEVVEVAELLAATDPVPLIEVARSRRDEPRPLWAGFGSCSVAEPIEDLTMLGLIDELG